MFILDTDHIGITQRMAEPYVNRLFARMSRHAAECFYVTIISFHEQMLGWHAHINRSQKRADVIYGYLRLTKLLTDFSKAKVLPYDDAAAEVFESLQSKRIRLGTMDLRIAAIALSRNMTVLTRNLRDFERVPGLRVEDWTV